jgi:hypothetical protein
MIMVAETEAFSPHLGMRVVFEVLFGERDIATAGGGCGRDGVGCCECFGERDKRTIKLVNATTAEDVDGRLDGWRCDRAREWMRGKRARMRVRKEQTATTARKNEGS